MNWLGAEGEINGLPIMIRIKEFKDSAPIEAEYNTLFSIDIHYEPSDSQQLPSSTQYDEISRFESDVIDVMENRGLITLAVVETGAGRVRYISYTSNSNDASSAADALCGPDLSVEFSSMDDPDWSEYRKRRDSIRQG